MRRTTARLLLYALPSPLLAVENAEVLPVDWPATTTYSDTSMGL